MPLDFVILGKSGAPDRTISLEVDLHHELVTAALTCGLSGFQRFADYYEDVDVATEGLSGLAEQVELLRSQINSVDLQHFLEGLAGLIACCIANGKDLHAIAD